MAFCFALVYKSLINDDNAKIYSKLEKGSITANKSKSPHDKKSLPSLYDKSTDIEFNGAHMTGLR